MLRKAWSRATIPVKLAVVVSLLVLLPLMILSYWLLDNWKESAVSERKNEAMQTLHELQSRVENTAELCNLSTQVFLNAPNLVEHLEKLDCGESLSTQELLNFYRNDIASLERVVVSNPYLYAIRVYSGKSQIDEMVPILYGQERMEEMEWYQEGIETEGWRFDYTDTLFSYSETPHIMSLITPVKENSGHVLGTVEVAVRMDSQFPELFSGDTSIKSCLILDNGEMYGSTNARAIAKKLKLSKKTEPVFYETTYRDQPMLVSSVYIKEMGITYLRGTSLTELYNSVNQLWLLLWVALLVVFAALCLGINYIVKNMLRELYGVLEGVRSFSQGNLDTEIEVKSDDEIGRFSRHVNGLLDNIRTLMQEQVRREVLIKNTEIHALQNQINAHFIYNVLEAIKMMAEIDEEYEIADAITSLGKLLRYSMKWDRGAVALWQEIDYIKSYISLMNLRYDWEISLNLQIPEKFINQELLRISLQPIVENAVVHGAAELERDSEVTIRVCEANGCCRIEISDEGVGLTAEQLLHIRRQISGEEETRSRSGNGIGLKNVQERIQMMFGKEYGLEAYSQKGEGTLIRLDVPIHPALEKEATNEQSSDCGRRKNDPPGLEGTG